MFALSPPSGLQACSSYETACVLRPASHAALYNWGVALSDMAHHMGGTDRDASYNHLLASAEKYGLSLKWNPRNPQASQQCHSSPRMT